MAAGDGAEALVESCGGGLELHVLTTHPQTRQVRLVYNLADGKGILHSKSDIEFQSIGCIFPPTGSTQTVR